MSNVLLMVGFLLVIFVGYNIGGATTGPAFGPAVGAGVISKVVAAVLMSICFLLGALTVGPEVVETLSEDLIHDVSVFTLQANVAILFVVGGALFLGNYAGVPASTSMTAVGAIAALGLATNELNFEVLGEIAVWWIVAPIIGFWVAGVVGRYFYPRINEWIAIEESDRDPPMVTVTYAGIVPRFQFNSNGTQRELSGFVSVVGIGCLMAYVSGTSNIANAIAPIYATNEIELVPLILVGSAAVALGAFTIARRTLETLGNDITNLPLTAAIVVAVISSILVFGLSAIGIPASFVVVATMSIVGLGWGRATRTTTLSDAAHGEEMQVSIGAVTADEEGKSSPDIGVEEVDDVPASDELFDPTTIARVVLMQNVVPIVSTTGAFVLFRFLPVFGF